MLWEEGRGRREEGGGRRQKGVGKGRTKKELLFYRPLLRSNFIRLDVWQSIYFIYWHLPWFIGNSL
jgi:hypothetical protein